MSGDNSSATNNDRSNNRWFNDRRFNFGPTAGVGRLRQNLNQFLAEINQTARQNPELVGQLRTQLQAISDLLNSQQGDQNQQQNANATAPVHQGIPSTSRQNSADSNVGFNRRNLRLQLGRNRRLSSNDDDPRGSREGEVAINLEGNPELNYLDDFIPESDDTEDDRNVDDGALIQPPDPLPAAANQQQGSFKNIHVTKEQATETLAEQDDDWQRISELLQSPEMQRAIKMALAIVPFILCVLIKMFIDHFAGLFTLAVFTLIFYYGNRTLHRTVSAREDAKSFDAFKVIIVLIAGLSNLYLFFRDENLWLSLLFQAPVQLEFADHVDLCVVLWIVLSTDYAVRFGVMILKALVTLIPRKMVGFKRKRNVYQWLEYSSQMYRHWLPVIPWWHYLMSTQSRHGFIIGLSFSLVLCYLAIKGTQGISKMKAWKASSVGLLKSHEYGMKPSSSDMFTSGPTCSICYGEYKDPLLLSCKHIFCEDCISTWFEREKTCPMCRAEVSQEDVNWKCGSTSWIPQLF